LTLPCIVVWLIGSATAQGFLAGERYRLVHEVEERSCEGRSTR